MVPAGVEERASQAEDRSFARERFFCRAEALWDDVAEVVIDDEVLGLYGLRKAVDPLGLGLWGLD
jgi:hypothetical protein